jgi:hypothetical protein
MLELFIVIVRGLALALRGHQELVFENLALRQQLMSIKRATKRHRVEARDRLFWIALARCRLGAGAARDRCAAASRLVICPVVDEACS